MNWNVADAQGYCTGYVYRDSRQRTLRSQSTTDVPTQSLSSFSEDKDLSNLSLVLQYDTIQLLFDGALLTKFRSAY